MKIQLAADYRGQLTGERFYRAGVLEVGIDIPEDFAMALVQAGRAVEVETVRATVDNPPAPGKTTVVKRKGGL